VRLCAREPKQKAHPPSRTILSNYEKMNAPGICEVFIMSNFFEDFVINKLNGYYLILYAKDRKTAALCMYCINHIAVYFMVFLGLIPPRIRRR